MGSVAPYHGGNVSNGLQMGTLYLNVNNSSTNANWNIGAAVIY